MEQIKRKMGVCLAAAVGLLLAGCTPAHYDITTMPRYNVESANAEWLAIVRLDRAQEQVNYALRVLSLNPTEVQLAGVNRNYDLFLFHRSAAVIALFHGDYPAMNQSLGRAEEALKAQAELVMAMMKAAEI